ncbi:MAG TPA: oxidoreductase [Polyangiaceae bacterium]|nr:oxidoreductase [Polyangiaceae bacterium]HMR73890.1 oxidoreductase [Polyangiaceae bacterium]
MKQRKKKLAVFKFASCDGCQLSLLDCEDELLAVAGAVDIAHFLEASSRIRRGPYDVTLVEGSVTTEHDALRIQKIREQSKILVTIGACATSGGIQALRNSRDIAEMVRVVYASPQYISTLDTSTAISDHVHVDYELRGCPVNKHQLLSVLTSLLHGQVPRVPSHPVCLDCKRSGVVCVSVVDGTPCLGPVTHTGCDALCPRYGRGCFGCYGPSDTPQVAAQALVLRRQGQSDAQIAAGYASFNVGMQPFAQEFAKGLAKDKR